MAYSVTGIRSFPDHGFKAGSRYTAEGALEVAVAFSTEGMREIEVHDDRGRLMNHRELSRAASDAGAHERDVMRRLLPA